jgi:large subunit ribosomal protein L3
MQVGRRLPAVARAAAAPRAVVAAGAVAPARALAHRIPRHAGRVTLIPKPNSLAVLPPENMVTHDPETGWRRHVSKRTGMLAVKIGQTNVSDHWGHLWPITVLYVPEDQYVVQSFTEERDGFNAVQVGAIAKRLKTTPRAQFGHFARAGVPPLAHLAQFRVSRNAVMPVGTQLDIRHWTVGQKVTVTGTTLGKGTQGVMKRWGFKGLKATHGVSRAHRSGGATGQCQDPGKVFKGKKMAGRMGNKSATIRNLTIYEMDLGERTIGVIGSVPGFTNGIVRIVDSLSEKWLTGKPAYPTFLPAEDELEPPTGVITKDVTKPWPSAHEEEDLPPLGTPERAELDAARQDDESRAATPRTIGKIWGMTDK